MKLSDVANEVIRLDEAIYEYWERELLGKFPPLDGSEIDPGPPPPEEQQLRDLLTSLPEDAVYKLFLLVGLGKKYYGVERIAEEYASLKAAYPKVSVAVERLMAKASLAHYLNEGLEVLRQHGISVDSFMPVKASA